MGGRGGGLFRSTNLMDNFFLSTTYAENNVLETIYALKKIGIVENFFFQVVAKKQSLRRKVKV